MVDPEVLWNRILAVVSHKVHPERFRTWLGPTKGVEFKANTLLVEVPNPFFIDWIGQYLAHYIEEAVVEVVGEEIKVVLKPAMAEGGTHQKSLEARSPRRRCLIGGSDGSRLQPRYTFKNFVVGESNRFAHAGALAVAEAPAEAYNPLFIYSGVGLGKTHLLQAIGNYVKENKGELKVYYTPAENFFIELITAIKKDLRMEFKNKYRSKDLLLIDDIHYLIGKEGLQEEIFHTFNYLYNNGKQIVISSDRPPKELPTLEERLISRFGGGLVVDIQPPDLETRMAILQRKAEMEGCTIPQDVAYFVASHVRSNIRELEGCLIRLLAISSVSGEELSVGLAQKVLKDFLGQNDRLSKELIVKRVAGEFGVSVAEIKGPRRRQELVQARHVAMYLLKSLLNLPLTEIGRYFGSRDHTTVIHAYNKVTKLSEQDPQFAGRLRRLIMAIRGV